MPGDSTIASRRRRTHRLRSSDDARLVGVVGTAELPDGSSAYFLDDFRRRTRRASAIGVAIRNGLRSARFGGELGLEQVRFRLRFDVGSDIRVAVA